ncbi:MAG: type 4a pilus biogenesis protein PilO [Thermodesulfovibrionales bacterium]|nr:type 4a pilus biogenesis protein PilO [Thermodesulfovibrionales bacterium]
MAKINIKNLKNLPKSAAISIAVVPAVLFTLVFGYLVLLPKNKQVEQFKQDISAQENEITKSQSMADRLYELKAENQKLKERLQELEKQLPEEKEISVLLSQVSDLGIRAGLEILTWKPSPRVSHSSGIVYEVPVSVDMKGSYHRLGAFFSSLTRLDRIVNITNIRLSGPQPKGNEAMLGITFSALTFTAVSQGGIAQ